MESQNISGNPRPQSSSRFFKFLVISLTATIVCLGAILYIKRYLILSTSPKPIIVRNNHQQSAGPAAQVPALAESLNEYQDIESGFQFNFPSAWKVMQYKTGQKGSPESYSYIQSPNLSKILHKGEESYYELKEGAEISVYVQVSPSLQTIKDLQEFSKLGRGGPAFVNERIIKVGDIDALLHDFIGYGGSSGHRFELLHNNRWIRVDIGYKGLNGKKVLDEVISTFNFLISGFYRHDDYGFEFSYPNELDPHITEVYENHSISPCLVSGSFYKKSELRALGKTDNYIQSDISLCLSAKDSDIFVGKEWHKDVLRSYMEVKYAPSLYNQFKSIALGDLRALELNNSDFKVLLISLKSGNILELRFWDINAMEMVKSTFKSGDESFVWKYEDTYAHARDILKERGWMPIMDEAESVRGSIEFQEIVDCGLGLDAVCHVSFKKGYYQRHLYVAMSSQRGFADMVKKYPKPYWIVLGDE